MVDTTLKKNVIPLNKYVTTYQRAWPLAES